MLNRNVYYVGSGSDAASLQTTATYDDKTDTYVLNGSKSFISNAGKLITHLIIWILVIYVLPLPWFAVCGNAQSAFL